MLKEELRAKYGGLRKSITSAHLLDASLSISNKLLGLPIWSFEYYHLFLSIPEKKEIDTTFILSILQGKDKNIVFPKVFPKGELKHYLLTDNLKLQKNKWGIPEPMDGIEVLPKKLDVVFVPLLAFDSQGNRVGYGRGFYDKFLGQCRPDTLKIGLCVFGPEPLISDVEETDVRLDYCVTPDTIYRFSPS